MGSSWPMAPRAFQRQMVLQSALLADAPHSEEQLRSVSSCRMQYPGAKESLKSTIFSHVLNQRHTCKRASLQLAA